MLADEYRKMGYTALADSLERPNNPVPVVIPKPVWAKPVIIDCGGLPEQLRV